MIKGDSLPEQLMWIAKHAAFVSGEEREVIKRAAMRIQTLQAERTLMLVPANLPDMARMLGSFAGRLEERANVIARGTSADAAAQKLYQAAWKLRSAADDLKRITEKEANADAQRHLPDRGGGERDRDPDRDLGRLEGAER